MKMLHRLAPLGLLSIAALPTAVAIATTGSGLPEVHRTGSVAYVTGGGDPEQTRAIDSEAARYPVEVDFLWGRGAKETPIPGAQWSIRNAAGHDLVDVASSGPLALVSLPDGRYTLTARYEGTAVSRTVAVHKGAHDIVAMEWPQ